MFTEPLKAANPTWWAFSKKPKLYISRTTKPTFHLLCGQEQKLKKVWFHDMQEMCSLTQLTIILSPFMCFLPIQNILIQVISWEPTPPRSVQIKIYGQSRTTMINSYKKSDQMKISPNPSSNWVNQSTNNWPFLKLLKNMTISCRLSTWEEQPFQYSRTLSISVSLSIYMC